MELKLSKKADPTLFWPKGFQLVTSFDIDIPGRNITSTETEDIQPVVDELWKMSLSDRRIVLMVLTQLCDSLVWWTQRYKIKDDN